MTDFPPPPKRPHEWTLRRLGALRVPLWVLIPLIVLIPVVLSAVIGLLLAWSEGVFIHEI